MKLEQIRLQKFLAAQGLGSRRAIEQMIIEGRIKINGKVAVLGEKILGNEKIYFDGKLLRFNPQKEIKRQVLIYNKRVGEICARKDPENRPTVYQNLPKIQAGRWVMVGRLDLNSSGLLLFTNDGELANKLMHPSSQIEREYWVRVGGTIAEETLEQLKQGVKLEEGIMKFNEIIPLKVAKEEDSYNKFYSVIIKEGKKREVRRLFEAVGCMVSRLKRVRYGTVILPRYLKEGKTQFLDENEIKKLVKLIRNEQ